ncbi:MAG: hypothetical protein IT298_15480 [Chloroflexi bacterium]|jgi:hypothetical protein|nr:MAG: hypothetical protein UZ13_00891 [Chloroflexi bacterium OLB13]MBC6956469.1 hypothetical protein [Chloroflexota bacterium]MBV6435802.1 hypothetical protein [Anaerolineae bacterium]MDL1915997.1 hypothetical protein [Anaerolineae bacterium CFX4]OQY84426.1 MAG: hypothetical protein B6D42_05295 [Anaerolineae bacterium UTCFX5]
MMSILVHLANSEPIKLDVEALPNPNDTVLVGRNPRDHVDRELNWIDEGVRMVILPWWRINYVQVLPSAEEQEEFPLLFRND